MPRDWRYIGLRTVLVSGKEYYEVYYGKDVGDISTDWREIDDMKKKLFMQITRHKELIDHIGERAEHHYKQRRLEIERPFPKR
jgi:hypothetical protein